MDSWIRALKAALFDFDGVLIDSGGDIAAAVNEVLIQNGLAPLSENQIIGFVGNGAEYLLAQSLAASCRKKNTGSITPDTPRFKDIYNQYTAYYKSHCVERTVLYPGAEKLLDRLREKHIPCGIVSNKPYPISDAVLKKLGIESYFTVVIGPEQLTHMKPHPEGLEKSLQEINKRRLPQGLPAIRREETLMVGDSLTDIQAGIDFGCRTCAVTGGLGNREKLLSLPADITVQYAGDLTEYI